MIMKQLNDKHCSQWESGVRLYLLCFISFFAVIACSSDNLGGKENPHNKPHRPSTPVTVTGIGPGEGGLGTKVVVNGENFGNDPAKVTLYFNDKKALILGVQDNAIYAMVPRQPGEYSTIKVDVEGNVGELVGIQFKYHIRATVTTVAGVWKQSPIPHIDGPALESTFIYPNMLAVDDEGNVLISDGNDPVRLLSTKENKVTTVFIADMPWHCAFNPQYTHCYVLERNERVRPILFHGISKESDYTNVVSYYDQQSTDGKWIFGDGVGAVNHTFGLTADETYVYLLNENATRLVRIHQINKTVERIGENLGTGQYTSLTYNQADGMIYMALSSSGRIVRFNPYHTPVDKTIPWITWDDMEWIVGTGTASTTVSREGNGRNAQLGRPFGIASDLDGNIYVNDRNFHCIWKIDPLFNCTVFAGAPAGPRVSGYRDGKPEDALFNDPYGVSTSPDGLIYVADTGNRLIRCIAVQ